MESEKYTNESYLTVEPIHDGDGNRIGTRVRDQAGVELEETDPRFRAAAVGKVWLQGATPPPVTDDDCAGIVGGVAILKRALSPASHRSPADAAALERARERIVALKDRQ